MQNIQQWLEKARRYCDQQERCIYVMEKKLREWGCDPGKTKEVLKQLIKSGHIDEQRFAGSFAKGKFRIKKWGRIKIMAAMHQLKIPAATIQQALEQIDEEEYRTTLAEILEKKYRLTAGDETVRKNRTASFAIGKGFESTLVFEILKTINTQ